MPKKNTPSDAEKVEKVEKSGSMETPTDPQPPGT